VEMLASPRADEGNVLEQIDEVLAAEARIKRSQMTLLVRIKNILTPEQQDRLSELRGAGSEDQFEPAGDRR